MKPNQPSDPDPQFRALLQEWKIDASLPPRFQDRVWQRVARTEMRVPAVGGLTGWVARWQSILLQPRLAAGYVGEPMPVSPLQGKPVADLAHKLHPYVTGWFHRRWERKPLLFTAWTLAAVAVASLFEIVPTFMI